MIFQVLAIWILGNLPKMGRKRRERHSAIGHFGLRRRGRATCPCEAGCPARERWFADGKTVGATESSRPLSGLQKSTEPRFPIRWEQAMPKPWIPALLLAAVAAAADQPFTPPFETAAEPAPRPAARKR